MRTFLIVLFLSVSMMAQGVGTVGFNATKSGSSGDAPGTVRYYGRGCAGTLTQTCETGTTSRGGLVGYPIGATFTTGAQTGGYTATHCSAYYVAKDGTNGHYRCAIYTAAGALVTNCSQTSNQNIGTVPGWTETTMPASCVLSASTAYVIFMALDGMGTQIGSDVVQSGKYITQVYGSWAGTATINPSDNTAAYVKVTAN